MNTNSKLRRLLPCLMAAVLVIGTVDALAGPGRKSRAGGRTSRSAGRGFSRSARSSSRASRSRGQRSRVSRRSPSRTARSIRNSSRRSTSVGHRNRNASRLTQRSGRSPASAAKRGARRTSPRSKASPRTGSSRRNNFGTRRARVPGNSQVQARRSTAGRFGRQTAKSPTSSSGTPRSFSRGLPGLDRRDRGRRISSATNAPRISRLPAPNAGQRGFASRGNDGRSSRRGNSFASSGSSRRGTVGFIGDHSGRSRRGDGDSRRSHSGRRHSSRGYSGGHGSSFLHAYLNFGRHDRHDGRYDSHYYSGHQGGLFGHLFRYRHHRRSYGHLGFGLSYYHNLHYRRSHYYDRYYDDYYAGYYPYSDAYLYGPRYGATYIALDRQPEINNYYNQDIYYVTSPGEGQGSGVSSPGEAVYRSEPLVGPPDPTRIDNGLGLFRLGRFEEARREFVHAVLEDESDGYAQFFYGLGHFAVGDYSAAGLSMRHALNNAPELAADPLDVRAFYGDRVLFEAQLDSLAGYVGTGAGKGEAGFLLGYMYFASHQPKRAIATLQRYGRYYPTDEVAQRVLAAARSVGAGDKPSS